VFVAMAATSPPIIAPACDGDVLDDLPVWRRHG